MPGEFGDSATDQLEKGPVEDSLVEFVSEVLRRVEGLEDERVGRLREDWAAIRGADASEAAFCVAAGRLGVDPCDLPQVTDELATFLEEAIIDPEDPLARDLTEAAQPDSVAALWSWVRHVATTSNLGPMAVQPPLSEDGAERSPSRQGYRLAALVRQRAGIPFSDPLPPVEDVAHRVVGVPFRVRDQNHLPGSGVRAAVGWDHERNIVVVGRQPAREDGRRFLAARSLYHALFACERSERLVTDAFVWDQQVSRAFAAELLAPQAALTARTGSQADRAAVEALADEFKASTMAVAKQLENAGVVLVDES
jgi:hypothetical protein